MRDEHSLLWLKATLSCHSWPPIYQSTRSQTSDCTFPFPTSCPSTFHHRNLASRVRIRQDWIHKTTNDGAGPFSHEVTETLSLRNPHKAPVAFKVRPLRSMLANKLALRTRDLGQDYSPKAVSRIRTLIDKPKLRSSRYCVRPNSGFIQPNGTVDVQGTMAIK